MKTLDVSTPRRATLLGLASACLLTACATSPGPATRSGPATNAAADLARELPGGDGLADALAREIVLHAMSLVDTPYRRGGNTPDTGFDCSGLIGYVFRNAAGLAMPRTVTGLSAVGRGVPRGDVRGADLVFFDAAGPLSHAGIYVGAGRFVHAPSSGGRVRLDHIEARYWSARFATARRV